MKEGTDPGEVVELTKEARQIDMIKTLNVNELGDGRLLFALKKLDWQET